MDVDFSVQPLSTTRPRRTGSAFTARRADVFQPHFGLAPTGDKPSIDTGRAPRKTWRHRMRRWMAAVRHLGAMTVIAYSPFARLRAYAEEKIIFQPSGPSRLEKIQSPALRAQIRELRIPTTDGLFLHAWHIPAQPGKATVLFSHSNYDTMDRAEAIMARFVEKGCGFFAYDYRGYGKSEGKPSLPGLFEDLEKASDYLRDVIQVPVSEQIAVGESIGGVNTVMAASKRRFKAVVLLSAFSRFADSMRQAKRHAGLPNWLIPSESKIRHSLDAVAAIPGIQSPLVMAHGGRDTLVSKAMADTLFAHAPESIPKKFLLIERGGHCRLFSVEGEAIMAALASLVTL